MEVEQLPLFLELLANSGSTLNHEKCNLLMHSLVILQNENHFKKVYFWGVVEGVQEDYYISFGYRKDMLKGRTFYYSRNAITWVLLPVLKPKDRANYLSSICVNRFYGNPAMRIDILDEQPTDEGEERKREEDQLEGEGMSSNPFKESTSFSLQEASTDFKLKEEERLAGVVRFVNQEAGVVPRGWLWRRTDGMTDANPAFEGLTPDEAAELGSFLHLRLPRHPWQLNVARRLDFNYATDFLDTIAEDIPINCAWSRQLLHGKRVVILRNLYWPGFTFYHQLNSKIHGFIYIGTGMRNLDLPFMT